MTPPLPCLSYELWCFLFSLVDVGSWEDVFPFVKTLLSGDWRSFSLRALARAVKVSSDFASRWGSKLASQRLHGGCYWYISELWW